MVSLLGVIGQRDAKRTKRSRLGNDHQGLWPIVRGGAVTPSDRPGTAGWDKFECAGVRRGCSTSSDDRPTCRAIDALRMR